MISSQQAFTNLPVGLRAPLLAEYQTIVQNYLEHRWSPSELSGGRFAEIVYSIVDGYGSGSYASAPFKPASMVDACKRLENRTNVPRSFQILIPRLLPTLYEVRNNRGVGHVGGDVDPNHMDATLVLSMANWTMAELVRVFHSSTVAEAQELVESLAERRIPLVWQSGDVRRVLDPAMKVQDQILLLVSTSVGPISTEDLFQWLDYGNRAYFNRVIGRLHKDRCLNYVKSANTVQILPPGTARAAAVARARI
jgi:hypothetical protein